VLDGRTCEDLFEVVIHTADETWDQGHWKLEVTADGTTTSFLIPFTGNTVGVVNNDGPVLFSLAPRWECVTDGPNTSCGEVPGTYELRVTIEGKPQNVTINLQRDGMQAGTRLFLPEYLPTAPSPECAYMCERSKAEWILP